jgi:hypothetical protein
MIADAINRLLAGPGRINSQEAAAEPGERSAQAVNLTQ